MKDLTLIIPAKNEPESLPKVLNELKDYDVNIMIVLRKEDLETINNIKDFNSKITYQEGYGYGDALINGISLTTTKYFCIFNADGSFKPEELKNMYRMIENTNNDFIFASRYQKNSGSDDDTIITYVGNFIFTRLGNIFFNLKITDILYTYVLGKTEYAKKLKLKNKDFSFCVELPIKASRHNMKLSSISSYERKRIAGVKKPNAFKDGLLILISMILLFIKR